MRIIGLIGMVLAVMLATGCGEPTIEERMAASEADRTAIAEMRPPTPTPMVVDGHWQEFIGCPPYWVATRVVPTPTPHPLAARTRSPHPRYYERVTCTTDRHGIVISAISMGGSGRAVPTVTPDPSSTATPTPKVLRFHY